MIILVTDPFDKRRSVALVEAVKASRLVVDEVYDMATDGEVVNRYRLGDVPCLAKIHEGKAVDLIADGWATGKSAATIKGRFTAAVNAYEAAKVTVAAPSTASRIAAIEAELASLKAAKP